MMLIVMSHLKNWKNIMSDQTEFRSMQKLFEQHFPEAKSWHNTDKNDERIYTGYWHNIFEAFEKGYTLACIIHTKKEKIKNESI